jgi:MFS transporter, DHA1 family, inner membrane transport protein
MSTSNFSKFIGSEGRHASPARAIYPMRFLLAFAQGGLLSPLLPLLRETFHVSPGELGLLTSMSGLSSVMMDIIAAYLLQRRPLLSLLLQGIGLAGVALLGSMLAPGFYWLVAAQMFLGFGLGITRVACLMVIVTGTPRAVQGRANNLLEFSAIAGLTLSPTLSGLAASLLHWRAAFAVAMVFVAGAFGWVLYTRQTLVEAVGASTDRHNPGTPAAAQSAQRSEAPAATAVHTSVVGIAYVATFVLSFIWSGFVSTALPLFGGEVVGIPTTTLGLVFTAGLLVDLVLLLPMGWLSDRLEGRVVLTPALLLMAGALAYLPQATSLGGLFVISICLHTGFAAWGMPSAVLALCTPREYLARTMGIYRLLVDGAVVIAPWLVGTLIGLYGYGPPAWLTAALVILTALLVAQGLHAGRR